MSQRDITSFFARRVGPTAPPAAETAPRPRLFVDLFCGIGGSSTGLEAHPDIEVLAGADASEQALSQYALNHDHEALKLDLADVAATVARLRQLGRIDIISGSPPCQDFSFAGKRVEGDNASLTVRFAETVALLKPKLFFMENVPQVVSSVAWQEASSVLTGAGYALTAVEINAAHCGVPQARKRAIIAGV